LKDTTEAIGIYKKMDTIVFVSGDAKTAFLERFPAIHSHFEIIYNIINENSIIVQANAFEVERSAKFTFLNVGMLRKEKCQERLVRIARRLKDLGYDFQVQLIGDGPMYVYLSELITTSGVQDYVSLLGLKENPYPYMKGCDCFVLPSDYEGYGIAVKEALFLKKLILTTDVVGPREILDDGRFGLIVENDEDSLFRMMRHILDMHYDNREFDVMRNVKEYQGDNENIQQQLITMFS
jgi:glycosyltransferase involved in cell wall biosynthesis